jgi:cell pole-organizing protein PopZ
MGSASLKANEPSMEEILASIRRIIADDQEPVRPAEPEASGSSPLKNVLDIAELHVSPLLGANEPVLGPWSREDVAFQDPVSEVAPPEQDCGIEGPGDAAPALTLFSEPALRISAPATPAETLLSHDASASVSGAFERLGASMRPSQPQTVEDLMKEMLRPMLKAWLDDNLPSLVERLVRDEIERVTRCRG